MCIELISLIQQSNYVFFMVEWAEPLCRLAGKRTNSIAFTKIAYSNHNSQLVSHTFIFVTHTSTRSHFRYFNCLTVCLGVKGQGAELNSWLQWYIIRYPTVLLLSIFPPYLINFVNWLWFTIRYENLYMLDFIKVYLGSLPQYNSTKRNSTNRSAKFLTSMIYSPLSYCFTPIYFTHISLTLIMVYHTIGPKPLPVKS
jgi:hypothetical protein